MLVLAMEVEQKGGKVVEVCASHGRGLDEKGSAAIGFQHPAQDDNAVLRLDPSRGKPLRGLRVCRQGRRSGQVVCPPAPDLMMDVSVLSPRRRPSAPTRRDLPAPADDNTATDKRPPQRRAPPEAAFRITLRRNENAGSGAGLEVMGGIPKIVACVVHRITPQPHAHWLPDEEERPVGVVMRRARREDLYLFYRAGDSSLVLCTLPEKHQSKVMVVPLENSTAVRQAILGGNVCRIAFSALAPGRYLVVSFSMVRADELHREALLLRKQGMYGDALTLIEEVLELDPEDFEAWTRKGCLLREHGAPRRSHGRRERSPRA